LTAASLNSRLNFLRDTDMTQILLWEFLCV